MLWLLTLHISPSCPKSLRKRALLPMRQCTPPVVFPWIKDKLVTKLCYFCHLTMRSWGLFPVVMLNNDPFKTTSQITSLPCLKSSSVFHDVLKFKALTMGHQAPVWPGPCLSCLPSLGLICSPAGLLLSLQPLNCVKGLHACYSFFWNALLPESLLGILHLIQVPSGRPPVRAHAV